MLSTPFPVLAAAAAFFLASRIGHPAAHAVAWLFAAYLLSLRVFNRKWAPRPPGSPPHDAGWLPYVGHALALGADGPGLLRKLEKEHGPVFSMTMMGADSVHVMDPAVYAAVMRDGRGFSFDPVKAEFVARLTGRDTTARPEEGWSFHSQAVSDYKVTQKFLLNDAARLTARFVPWFADKLRAEVPPGGIEVDLFEFMNGLVWFAGSKAMFGTRFPIGGPTAEEDRASGLSAHTLSKMMLFDAAFPTLQVVPRSMLPKEQQEAMAFLEDLYDPGDQFTEHWTSLIDGCPGISRDKPPEIPPDYDTPANLPSPFIVNLVLSNLRTHLPYAGPKAMGLSMLITHWVSHVNTGPTAYWMVLHILRGLRSEEAWAADCLAEARAACASGAFDPSFPTPALDAALTETLRHTMSVFITREAVADGGCDLPGTPFRLPQGTRVFFFVPEMLHRDPGLYAGDTSPPTAFDPARHAAAGPAKTAARTAPFGAGASMCPGRNFARGEMRCAAGVMLANYEVELLEDGGDDYVRGRTGIGSRWPATRSRARISARASGAKG
ncbi:cytochrome P450 [Hyaloraphidium curvatum]|nr:cytochrome P450 [Hyaloraphidium curvatum]